VLDDDLMASIGPAAAGVVSSHHYSAAHPSPENKAYVEAFGKANKGMRPNFHSVGGYDGMHLLYQALKQTGGDSDGDKLLAAMKGMAWTSVRGPVSIDARTRDIVQNGLYPQGRSQWRCLLQRGVRPGRQGARSRCVIRLSSMECTRIESRRVDAARFFCAKAHARGFVFQYTK
jgi:hypothetical protein